MVSEGDENAGGDSAGAPEAAAAVDHHVLTPAHTVHYPLDECFVFLRLCFPGYVHVLYGEANDFYTLYEILLEQFGDP